jgi:hypothetical protein
VVSAFAKITRLLMRPPTKGTTMFITRIRNVFTPLEWTMFALFLYILLVATISFVDAVAVCGSEGFGPAAEQNC